MFSTEIECFGDIPSSRREGFSAEPRIRNVGSRRTGDSGYGGGNFGNDDFDLPLLIAQIDTIAAGLEHYRRSVAASIDRREAHLFGVRAFLRQSMSDGAPKGRVHSDATGAIAPQ